MASSSNHDPESEIEALARQTGFSTDAVASMLRSVKNGNGRMAQFAHPEFGGAGQWMQGGMLMITDFSDRDLKERIARLCESIAGQLSAGHRSTTSGSLQRQSQSAGGPLHGLDSSLDDAWWPAGLGRPETSGAQNDMRYAWFAGARRLAIDVGGTVTLYDTGAHRIGGVSQQQGGHRTLEFTSQHGLVDIATLPVVEDSSSVPPEPAPSTLPEEARRAAGPVGESQSDPFQALEKLAVLHARGIVGDDEFARKKAELLARI